MLKTALKLLFTLGFLWLAFHNIAWSELQSAYAKQQKPYLFAAGIAVILQAALGGLRWHSIRHALGSLPRIAQSLRIYFASNFFNSFLPSTLGGDAARLWLAKQAGDSVKETLYGVIIDRLMSLAGLFALVALTLPILAGYLNISSRTGAIGDMLFWLLLIAGYALLHRILPKTLRFVRFAWWHHAATAIHNAMHHKKFFALSLLEAMAAHVMYATAAYALALSLGLDIGWLACVTLVPLVLLISSMPISLGGWGIREISMVGILALAGIEKAPALLLSLQLGALALLISLAGGLFYLPLRK